MSKTKIGTYAWIINEFYLIDLPREELSLIDAHFFAASHHFYYSQSDDLSISRFHQELFWKHLSQMMEIISQGDFSKAFDNTQRGLDKPEGWNPQKRLIELGNPTEKSKFFPDPQMFSDMQPDPTYYPGDSLPYDLLLDKKVKIHSILHKSAVA